MDGVVRGWASFGGGGHNVGDPRVDNLTVTDIKGDLCEMVWACPTCNIPIGGAAIEIRAGLIEDVGVFRPDELSPEAYYLLQPDGSRARMQEWEDKPPDYYNQ